MFLTNLTVVPRYKNQMARGDAYVSTHELIAL